MAKSTTISPRRTSLLPGQTFLGMNGIVRYHLFEYPASSFWILVSMVGH